ncbi:MAG: nucleoside hydrolase [Anaerolineae bacterium]|nr:nucleoside hydrolase [Anaerolineae bacterium]
MTHFLPLIIDTDPGVDDALALAWLLTQAAFDVHVLGIGVVAGNTSVQNAARNALTVLHTVNRTDIPVAIGAKQPREFPLSQSNILIHGTDGLWGASQNHDLDGCTTDIATFYRDLALAHPGATLLTMGPLTNVALAIERYPQALAQLGRLLILGGTKAKGSMTPVSEYNFWQDPHAAQIVLASGLPITLLIRDAFTAFQLSQADLAVICGGETAVPPILRTPIHLYTRLYTEVGGQTAATIPDLAAVLVAVDPTFTTTQPALVKIITEDGLTRGQTIIGQTFSEQVTMIADDDEMGRLAQEAMQDPAFDFQARLAEILRREPANVELVTAVDGPRMRQLFLETIKGTSQTT